MSESVATPLFPDINNNGIIYNFGNGQTINGVEQFYPTPPSLSSTPESPWKFTQWGQPVYLNPADYVQNDPSTFDPAYGDALYCWTQPGTSEAFSIYQQPPGGASGYVYQLTGGNANNEADVFLGSPAPILAANDTLNHLITYSLDAKLKTTLFEYDPGYTPNAFGPVAGCLEIGFTLNYNGAGGLPDYSGFAQIVIMTSAVLRFGNSSSYSFWYTTPPMSPTARPSQFIYSNLMTGDAFLPLVNADSNANPDLLTYNVNTYAMAAIGQAYINFSAADQAYLLNPANWSLGGTYVGLATQNEQNSAGAEGNVVLTAQLSNISLTTDLNSTYDQSTPPPPVAAVDTNPTISFFDSTFGIGGTVDGSYYSGSNDVQAKYIYTGADSIWINAPTGLNWMFGGGSAATGLTATSGDNTFVASTGSSFMIGGSGNDTFDIPDATITGQSTWDTINNFHAGDTISLADLGAPGWTYNWTVSLGASGYQGLTLDASNANSPTSELVTIAGSVPTLLFSIVSTIQSDGSLSLSYSNQPTNTSLLYIDETNLTAGLIPGVLGEDNAQISATALYYGSDTMDFLAPTGTNWTFGGGSGLSCLTATSGNNTFVASTGSSIMTGGNGDDTFDIPDPTITGKETWDTIINFHYGDTVSMAGVAGPGWTYTWLGDLGSPGNTGETLWAINSNSNVAELVTFSGIDSNQLSLLQLMAGGAPSNNLQITHQ